MEYSAVMEVSSVTSSCPMASLHCPNASAWICTSHSAGTKPRRQLGNGEGIGIGSWYMLEPSRSTPSSDQPPSCLHPAQPLRSTFFSLLFPLLSTPTTNLLVHQLMGDGSSRYMCWQPSHAHLHCGTSVVAVTFLLAEHFVRNLPYVTYFSQSSDHKRLILYCTISYCTVI